MKIYVYLYLYIYVCIWQVVQVTVDMLFGLLEGRSSMSASTKGSGLLEVLPYESLS